MTSGQIGWATQKSVEVTLEYLAKDPNKLYPASELDINDLISFETSFKLVIKELLSSGAVQEVSENTYKITTKGLERVVDELKKELLILIQRRSNEDYYTMNGFQEALSQKELAKIVFQMALEKLCQEDHLKLVKIRDETTNIETSFYDVTERVIRYRKELRAQHKKTEKKAKKKLLPPTKPITDREERDWKYDYEVELKRKKDRKIIIISIAVFVVAVIIVVLVGIL